MRKLDEPMRGLVDAHNGRTDEGGPAGAHNGRTDGATRQHGDIEKAPPWVTRTGPISSGDVPSKSSAETYASL